MKIHFERKGVSFDFDRPPLSERRFRALCSLVLAAIAGGVFLGAVALVGTWAIVAALAAFFLYGLYKLVA